MGCGCGGGGGVSFTSYVPSGGGQPVQVENKWRVTYVENGQQMHQDFPSDERALGFAGAVGGTLSRIAFG